MIAKIKYILLLFIFFSLFACSGNKDKKLPKVSIQPATMLQIMTDMSKAERMTMDNNLSKEERQQLMQEYKQSILKHYNISEDVYDNDMQTYLDNPKLMQKLAK